MKTSPVRVEILEQSPNSVKLKTPFIPIPIEMNHDFFNRRLQQGYFLVEQHQGEQFNS
jgi:hypothetical protein